MLIGVIVVFTARSKALSLNVPLRAESRLVGHLKDIGIPDPSEEIEQFSSIPYTLNSQRVCRAGGRNEVHVGVREKCICSPLFLNCHLFDWILGILSDVNRRITRMEKVSRSQFERRRFTIISYRSHCRYWIGCLHRAERDVGGPHPCPLVQMELIDSRV